MYKDKIDAYIDSHKQAMIEDLKKLVAIDSQRTEAKEGMPFGEGPAEALAAAKELMESYGFLTKNYDNYVVTGDMSEQEKALDILAHLDVVPVTDDWKVTKPFTPLVTEDRIYGRGTADDKGPAIAALYAMRAVKELGIPLKKSVRLILGSDEECGSSDLRHYYSIEEEAPATFTPDADFPVINIEKGQLQKQFMVPFREDEKLPRILQIRGGDKVNVVPGKAYAVIQGMDRELLKEAAKKTEEETGVIFTIYLEEKGIMIEAKGAAGHASTPEMGKNAVTALLKLLTELPFAESAGFEKLKETAKRFPYGDYHGAGLGVDIEDEVSGKLTMNLGIFDYSPERLCGQFDSRIPICGTDENVTNVIRESFLKAGINMEAGSMVPPHHVPAESEFVKTLLESYEKYTGIHGKPLAIGGGTYVHELKRGVAFGCMSPEVDNHMHGDDEFMELEVLFKSAKIFADVIVKLCA